MRYRCLNCGYEGEAETFPGERQCPKCQRKRVIEAYKWEQAVDKMKGVVALKPDANPLEALDDFLEVESKVSPLSSFRSSLRGELEEAHSDPLLRFKIGYQIIAEARQKLRQEKQL
jgi:DNA-directed RNA polymerase subunit RPC12/RpoP